MIHVIIVQRMEKVKQRGKRAAAEGYEIHIEGLTIEGVTDYSQPKG
jgi:hypothetical protein